MRVDASSLVKRLGTGLPGACLLCGPEPLLVEESCDVVRRAARAQGFVERLRFDVDSRFDWDALAGQSRSLSLFATRRLIELRIPTGRPGEVGGRCIAELAAEPPADTSLMIIAGRIERAVRSSKWFKAVERHGIVVEHPLVDAGALPSWIRQRLRSEGLSFDEGVVERLSHLLEGNLLAAAQEIRLLALLAPDNRVRVDDVDAIIADHARFDVFAFVDACLAGRLPRALRILGGLRREGIAPPLIQWALAREARAMAVMAQQLEGGATLAKVLQANRVWEKNKKTVAAALRRVERRRWLDVVRLLARADRVLKGRESVTIDGDVWQEFEKIALALSGKRWLLAAQQRTGQVT